MPDTLLALHNIGYRVRAAEFRQNKFQLRLSNGRWYVLSPKRLNRVPWSETERDVMMEYLAAYNKKKNPAG